MYAALRLAGRDVNRSELVAERYVGADGWSTLDQLARLAEDHNLYALAVRDMPPAMLETSQYPIVLLVKKHFSASDYDHYVLYIGNHDGYAHFIDLPHGLRSVPQRNLYARWGGVGILLSMRPISISRALWKTRIHYAFGSLLIIIVIVLARSYWLHTKRSEAKTGRRKLLKTTVKELSLITVVSVVCALAYHATNARGFISVSDSVLSFQRDNAVSIMNGVDFPEVLKHIDKQDAVFVDARMSADFAQGHIEGAINVPVTSSILECEALLEDISRHTAIVIYCQSRGCNYAKVVANKLFELGYTNVALYEPGWTEISSRL